MVNETAVRPNSTAMVKIVILGALPPPYGGPEVMMQALLAGLRPDKKIAVHHINTQVSRSLAEKGGKHQLRKSISGAYQVMQLIRQLITFSPDMVYLTLTNSPSFLGFLRDSPFMLATLLFGKKLAVWFLGGHYFYAHTTGLKRAFVRLLLSRVSLAAVEGQGLKGVFQEMVPRERITVMPNSVDDSPFREARRRRANKADPDSLKRILFVGLMCPEKGVRDIMAAVPQVPAAHFIFAGEWPSAQDEREVLDFLHQNRVADRVTFTGVVSGPAKFDLFCSSDIFVFPTYFVYEGHAVSSVEALAAGLPIICTDHGALNESVRDGWNGFFVPQSDPAAIARRLNQLLSDDELRRTMGERSRRLYTERFTLSQYVENWSEAIRRGAAI
jgi:glycosyltransferase involved in cell wall biosynthesis